MMTNGLDKVGQVLLERGTPSCTVDCTNYGMVVVKNPNVGREPPQVVPFGREFLPSCDRAPAAAQQQ